MSYFFERFIYHFMFFVYIGAAGLFGFWAMVTDKKVLKVMLIILTIFSVLLVVGRIVGSLSGVDGLWNLFIWIREHIGSSSF